MQIGYIGLGKMGSAMVARLKEKGHQVVAFDPVLELASAVSATGVETVTDGASLILKLSTPRTLWLMVPSGEVDTVLTTLLPLLSPGDTIIDGGNSRYTETIRRAKLLAEKEVNFIDAGVSGGPSGARNGACIMAGGNSEVVERYRPLFEDLVVPEGFAYVGENGAGHFVKMVHNGIEYGMMQSIAEGFDLMHQSPFNLNLQNIAHLYNKGSVVESRLVGWLESALGEYGEALAPISGVVGHLGEGQWTIETARTMNVPPLTAIESAFQYRILSAQTPDSFRGKVLSALRNQFGGHAAVKENPHA